MPLRRAAEPSRGPMPERDCASYMWVRDTSATARARCTSILYALPAAGEARGQFRTAGTSLYYCMVRRSRLTRERCRLDARACADSSVHNCFVYESFRQRGVFESCTPPVFLFDLSYKLTCTSRCDASGRLWPLARRVGSSDECGLQTRARPRQ